MKIKKMENPDIHCYLNIHHYLEDLYNYKKNTIQGFSYDSWASEIGFKDRSYLRQIVIGRRGITENSLKLLQKNLNLSPEQKEYFDLLCMYSKSKSSAQRNIFGRKLMQKLKSEYLQSEIENYYDLVSNHLTPKVQTLLTFVDIKKNVQSLSDLLMVPIELITDCLKKLKDLQLVDEIETRDGIQWLARERNFKIKDKLGNPALQEYHHQCLQEAIKSITLPVNERRFRSLILPLNEEEFDIFLNDLNLFINQTLKKFDADDLRKRKLYQINFNAHPVSKQPDDQTIDLF